MQKVLYWISQERFLNKDVSYLTQRVADLTHWQRRLGFLSREKTSLPREQEPTCPKIILPGLVMAPPSLFSSSRLSFLDLVHG